MVFEYHTTVRGYELDSYNHLNNAVYLNYMEQARWEVFKDLDLFGYFQKNNLFLVVVNIHIRYIREAKLFDKIIIKTTMEKKHPYLLFKHKMYNFNTNLKVSQAEVKTLLINKERIPMDIPDDFFREKD